MTPEPLPCPDPSEASEKSSLLPASLSSLPKKDNIEPNALSMNMERLSQIQLLTSRIPHVCQEICDIKEAKKTRSNLLQRTYTSTHLDEVQTNQTNTQEPNSSSFAKEGSDDEGGLGDIYSSRSIQYHHEPSNPDNSSRHAPVPPSLNPLPVGSNLEPPGDLSPSPASKIGTSTPSSPV